MSYSINEGYLLLNLKIIVISVVAVVLSSCGGARSGVTTTESPPTIPVTLSVEYDISEIKFNWNDDNISTTYQLLSSPNFGNEFTLLKNGLTATTTSLKIPVHLHNWGTQQYKIRSCNSAACIDSNSVNIRNQSKNAIGFVKSLNNDAGDAFGYAVTLSGDGNTMAVSAPREDSIDATNLDDGSAVDSGAVYIYSKRNDQWQFKTYLKAATIIAGSEFGSSLALNDDGTVLVVGEWLGNGGISNSGAAYIFALSKNNDKWQQIKKIIPLTPKTNAYFGFTTAISGDGNTIVVGAPGNSGDAAVSQGYIYVLRKENLQWPNSGVQITASDSADFHYFGNSVDINFDGTRLVTGKSQRAATNFYIFDYTLTASATIKSWVETKVPAAIINEDFIMGFGAVSMDNSGDVIVVGQIGAQVHVYKNELDLLTKTKVWNNKFTYLSQSRGGLLTPGELFSGTLIPPSVGTGIIAVRSSIAISGDGKSFIVGASTENTNKNGVFSSFSLADGLNDVRSGGSYLFQESASNQWTAKRFIKSANVSLDDFFAASVSISNDAKTLVIGAFGESSDGSGIMTISPAFNNELNKDSGAAYVY